MAPPRKIADEETTGPAQANAWPSSRVAFWRPKECLICRDACLCCFLQTPANDWDSVRSHCNLGTANQRWRMECWRCNTDAGECRPERLPGKTSNKLDIKIPCGSMSVFAVWMSYYYFVSRLLTKSENNSVWRFPHRKSIFRTAADPKVVPKIRGKDFFPFRREKTDPAQAQGQRSSPWVYLHEKLSCDLLTHISDKYIAKEHHRDMRALRRTLC